MPKRQTTPDLGEHEIIRLIQNSLTPMPNAPVPFGDDVAAVKLGNDKVGVLKTDMLVGKTDIPKGMSLWQAARKAIVMNVSDFASKGVKPSAALVALGLPKTFTKTEVEEIGKGLNSGAREHDAYVIGGDTGEASDLTISVSLFGVANQQALMLRSGAKPEDILAVTGFFGKPPAGLLLLLGKEHVAEVALRRVLVDAVFMPKARLAEGLALANSGAVSASMDSSDGLAWTLHELARCSNVGFELSSAAVSPEIEEFARRNGLDAVDLALYGGEEYELVMTIKPQRWDTAVAVIEAVGGSLLQIGKATKEKEIILNLDGKKRWIEARGWEHFKS